MEELKLHGFPGSLLSMFAAFLLLAAASTVRAAPPAGHLQSGIYEGLMLAVDRNGKISGYYRETQGEGVTKTCSFFLSGNATSDQIDVTTWNLQAFPGLLKSEDKGVALTIERGREHPGCGLVLLPEIAQGIRLDLTLATDWIALRRIVSPRAYFFAEPSERQKTNSYVTKGDIVGLLSVSGDWLEVEYPRQGNKTIKGWIRSRDSESLRIP
jgi:hypothetical protein